MNDHSLIMMIVISSVLTTQLIGMVR